MGACVGSEITATLVCLKGTNTMSDEYSLDNVLAKMYQNQLALEAALMELTLYAEEQGADEVGVNVRGALYVIGENAGFINQGLARLKSSRKG